MTHRIKPVTKQRRQARKEQAEARNAERAKLSNKEQLAKLDVKLGDGVGAKKERARLAK